MADGWMPMAFRAAFPLLCAFVLAGCAGPGGGEGVPEEDVPVLDATSSTGVIRSVVVDEAIRPIGGANVTVSHEGSVLRTVVTGEDGFAGFEGLRPGAYLVEATKRPLFVAAQQTVDVVAGVDDPPAVKLQLVQRTGDLPFYQEYQLDAFLECSGGPGNWCFIANYYPCLAMQTAGQPCLGNVTNDNSFFHIPLEPGRYPDRLQGEMVWESTQAAFTYMNWRFDVDDPATVDIDDVEEATGPSPLLIVYPRADMETYGLTFNSTLAVEAFHAGSSPVCDNDPSGDTLCVYTGAAFSQRFTYYIHVFYGYEPPEGWRFSDGAGVPQPP